MKEKIIKMLRSSDREIVILGMVSALQDIEWCLANLPYSDKAKDAVKHGLLDGYLGVQKDDVMIYAGAYYIHCRRMTDFDVDENSIIIKL